jgi:hypothetical protein
VKPLPRLCSTTPVPGTTIPAPKVANSELMNEIALPRLSAAAN